MPEGHTIHRLARDHAEVFVGRVWHASSPQGRFAAGAALLDGRRVQATDPHGKHLFYLVEGDLRLHVHLGLYGAWTTGSLPAPEPRGALRLRLVTTERYADLRGPTACEVLTPQEQAAIVARLGPDPLRADADPGRAWRRILGSRAPIGALLMDQTVLAGVGNVYRAEALYRAGVNPFLPGRGLSEQVVVDLWQDLVVCMRAGVRAGRIVTTAPGDRARRSGRARREDSFYVYRRSGLPCRRCATPIRTEVMVGRNLFWCPSCQAGAGGH